MPTYDVTDNLTGKSYELSGDSPPTEAELQEIFVGSGKAAVMSAATPPPQTSQNRLDSVEKLIQGRRDLLNETAPLAKDYTADELRNMPLDKLSEVAQLAELKKTDVLAGLGGLGQRTEAMGANPIIAAQQGRFGDMIGDAVKGATGERLGERGDVLRNLGAPELVAATGGLLTPGIDIAYKGVKQMRSVMASLGKQNAEKAYKTLWGGLAQRAFKLNEDEMAFVALDNNQWLDPKVMKGNPFKIGKAFDYTTNVVRDVGKQIFKPASEAWTKLTPWAKNTPLSPAAVQDVFENLDAGLVKSADEKLFTRLYGTGEELKGGNHHQSRSPSTGGVVDNGVIGDILNRAKNGSAKVSELIQVQKDLRAAGSVSARMAATQVNKILGKHYEEVADAVKKSSLQHQAEDILDNLGARYTKANRKFIWDEGKKSTLLNYFGDENQAARKSMDKLRDLYKSNRLDTAILERNDLGLKRANIAFKFRSEAAQGGNVSRLAALGPAFLTAAGLAPFVGKPVAYAGGALVGGYLSMQATSPRSFAKMATYPSRIEAFMNKPLTKFVRELNNRASTMGATRVLTGRGLETEQE